MTDEADTPPAPGAPDERRAHLDRQRRELPDEPGIYVYTDAAGNVLYVGKAKSLRKRVAQYFTGANDAKTTQLVMRIANLEVTVVGSEAEALMLEQKLIRRYRPPFNIALRDDKSYPYIAVTVSDEYPRVMFTREKHRRGVRYFGPYSSARTVRRVLDLLNRVFPYRPCEGAAPGRQSGTPCLDFHIERCAAPCIGNISRDDYAAIIDEVTDVLRGHTRTVEERLEQQMLAASAELNYELAARLRNRIAHLQEIAELQAIREPSRVDYDVMGVAIDAEADTANVQVLQVRDGQLTDRHSAYLEHVAGQRRGQVLAQFALGWYGRMRPVPNLVAVEHGLLDEADAALVAAELGILRGSAVTVRGAQRGEKRRLAALAQRNAEHALAYDTIRERVRIERRQRALEELRDALDLEALPMRMECYDISNLQDEAPVASMVVFDDGMPRRDHYRNFTIRHEGGQDDFAMMEEALRRRLAYIAPGADGSDDESFTSPPDLIVIDGGKGQLGRAAAALAAAGVSGVSLCSLAKREEEVFLPGRSVPVILDRGSPALHVLQRIRDEAHRVALGHHRTRRSADRHRSILDDLVGVGPHRRRALLNFFGSPERVMEATLDEIEAVPGLPAKVARSIHEQIHRLDGNLRSRPG